MLTIFEKVFNRATSRVYAIFASWIVLFHLPVIYVALFTNEELLFKRDGMLKGEYIVKLFYHNFSDAVAPLYIGLSILVSLIFTRFAIYVFPRWVVRPAYRAELDAQFERKKMRKIEEINLQKMEAELLKAEKINLEQESQNIQKKESNERQLKNSQEGIWLSEYREFQAEQDLFRQFGSILEDIYTKKRGVVDRGEGYLPIVRYAHAINLLNIKRDAAGFGRDVIDLTDKGKFFAAQYMRDGSGS